MFRRTTHRLGQLFCDGLNLMGRRADAPRSVFVGDPSDGARKVGVFFGQLLDRGGDFLVGIRPFL